MGILRDPRRGQADTPNRPRSPIRGVMIGLNHDGSVLYKPPLVLRFTYNPNKFKDRKSVVWAVTQIPGLDRPYYTYSYGGERIIEFQLVLNAFEFGQGSSSPLNLPGTGGIQSEIAKLQSFMYPVDYSQFSNKSLEFFKGGARKIGANIGSAFRDFSKGGKKAPVTSQFSPPPKCLFIYGGNIHECFVKDIDFDYNLFDTLLNPIRAEARVTLAVDENSARVNFTHKMRRMNATLGLGNLIPRF